jgi:hypothetical protein
MTRSTVGTTITFGFFGIRAALRAASSRAA